MDAADRGGNTSQTPTDSSCQGYRTCVECAMLKQVHFTLATTKLSDDFGRTKDLCYDFSGEEAHRCD